MRKRQRPADKLIVTGLALFLCLTGCAPDSTPPTVEENADRVGVVITGWGDTKGMSYEYRKGIGPRSRAGAATRYPFEPCTDMHRGAWPFASQIGLVPHAISFRVPLLGAVYDSMGVYRRSGDGTEYISIYDDSVRLQANEIPDEPGIIRPMSESTLGAARNLMGIDPRDGTDLLAGIYQIGAPSRERGENPLAMPNGLSDIEEIALAASMTDMRFMWDDQAPRSNETEDAMNEATLIELDALFGDEIDARFGVYVASGGIHPLEEDVALEMVSAGFTRLLLARETTDNNNYANDFMTRGYIDKALCRAGWRDDVEIQQVRQIGRTPEYNTMLLRNLAPHLARRDKGDEIVIVYTTYGLPFPGDNSWGPFATVYPLTEDVYHENAYLNYQSFKRYAADVFSDEYDLVFNYADKSGDLRTDSYYSYALFPPEYFGAPDDPLRYPIMREQIDRAKGEGRKHVIFLLSHWSHSNADNLIAMRKINSIPYNSRAEIAAGKHWTDWCEAPDSPNPISCESPDAMHLTVSEVFDAQAGDFGRTYANRIRGGVERFGVMPSLGIDVQARGPIAKRDGGSVAVGDGPLRGARLLVHPDPQPGKPEGFTAEAHEYFFDPAQPFESAWFNFDAYIGTQSEGFDRGALDSKGIVVSPIVLIGPYRTIFNNPARVSLPFESGHTSRVGEIRPYIYNEITSDWDPVYEVAGGSGREIDLETGLARFDVQVTGLFVLVVRDVRE